MPTINVTIPNKDFVKVRKQAEREGFKKPSEWALFLIEKNISFEESPYLRPTDIISDMRGTGLYQKRFLSDLKRSLEYADKTA